MANQCISACDILGSSLTNQQYSGQDNETPSSSNNDSHVKYFFLKPALRTALSSLGAIYKPYTFKEVLSLLKAYIFENKALDPQDSRFVLCANTDLGRAFGVDRFEYSQVRNLLSQNLFIASNIKIQMPNVPEQQLGYESEYSYQGYDTAVCEDSDDEYNDTEVVEEEEDDDEIEYELVTESETEIKDLNDSESDVESLILILGLEESGRSDEECFADESDSSSESSSSESEDNSDNSDDERDKWYCVNCGIKNKPFMRYCLKCWELRKDWYPEPPKRRRKRKARPKKDRKKMTPDIKGQDSEMIPPEKDSTEDAHFGGLERTSSTASSSTISSISSSSSSSSTISSISSSSSVFTASSQDSGFSSQDLASYEVISMKKRRTSESETGTKKIKKSENDGDDDDDGFVSKTSDDDDFVNKLNHKFKKFSNSAEGKSWLKSSKAEDLLDMLQGITSEDSEMEESPMGGNCIVCCTRPKNASIIHGRLSHIGFCYPCAKRLYNSKLKCPICRRKIHMITKNSYV